MGSRCKICGAPTSSTSICNYCAFSIEERRFLKMVNREELKSMKNIINKRKATLPKKDGVLRPKSILS